ncbi:MAG: glycosyltransferase family 2 protein [Candidatus Omnitrophica bacterium]|nr:glycosyltransferase family 2 protein [Candidatus Omnitrophota bacterium]
MNKVLVCPIAFNEHVKLKSVIERFLACDSYGQVDYLVMDDCSTDGTTELIQSYAGRGVQTIRHERQSGVGAAIRTAIRHARQQGYECLAIMAGNDKDNPQELPRIIDPILKEGYDFVQGSRYLGGGGTGGDMPFYRKLATRMHPVLMSMITGRRVTDSTNGFRAFRLTVLDDARINLDQPWLDKYELEPYLMFKAIKLGYKFTEAPVTKIYPAKKLGYTKMKPITGWWSILRPLIFLGLGIKK